jgi:hypothetical protein
MCLVEQKCIHVMAKSGQRLGWDDDPWRSVPQLSSCSENCLVMIIETVRNICVSMKKWGAVPCVRVASMYILRSTILKLVQIIRRYFDVSEREWMAVAALGANHMHCSADALRCLPTS